MNNIFFGLANKFKWHLLLLILICSIGWHYGCNKTIVLPPESTDIWRQSDCASFALNYYQNGMKFFHPQLHHCINMKNDGCSVSEFPILYYFVAILYKIFGVHEFLFRFTNMIIFMFGLWALYGIVFHFTKDVFYSLLLPVLLFSCPLIAFYSNNFLTDVPSLSFTFIGWNCVLKYKEKQKVYFFILSLLFLTLAVLLKANSVISFTSLGALFFIELNGWSKLEGDKKIFNNVFINIIGFAVSFLIIYVWYKWAIAYNKEHGSFYSLTKPWPGWPIWEVNDPDFVSTTTSIFFTFYSILDGYCAAIFLFCVPFVLLNKKYLPKFLLGIFVLLLCGSSLFLFYFFVGFRDQTYFYINLMMFPVFTFVAALAIMKEKYKEAFSSPIIKMMTIGLVYFNIDHTNTELNGAFYNGGWRDAKVNNVFYEPEFKKYFDKIVKEKTDIIISFPDTTPNASLYALNRRGYSNYGFPNDKIDSALVVNLINQGASYMVLANDELPNDPVLRSFVSDEIGKYKNVHIYSLKNIKSKLDDSKNSIPEGPVTFSGSNMKFVSCAADSSAELTASKTDAGNLETFSLIHLKDNKIALKTGNGKYVCVDHDRSCKLIGNRPYIGAWETFELIYSGKMIAALKADNGKYVTVNEKKPYQLIAAGDTISEKELFQFHMK